MKKSSFAEKLLFIYGIFEDKGLLDIPVARMG